MLLDLNHLTWLLARDDFLDFCCGESFKIHTVMSLLHKRIFVVHFYVHRLQKLFCRFQVHLRKLRPDQNENTLLILSVIKS